MSSRVIRIAALCLLALPCSTFAQTHPTTATTQPTVEVSPEVQALIPLIREGERLYKDIELSYRYTLRSTGPAPGNNTTIEYTITDIRSGSHWYSDTIQSIDSGRSEYHTVASWDGQFHRIFMEDLRKDDRTAAIGLGPSFVVGNRISPFTLFGVDASRPLVEYLVSGIPRENTTSQAITRLPDAELLNHRCARVQIAFDTPADNARPAAHITWTWHLLADAHYLPIRGEGIFHLVDGKKFTITCEAADVQEIAPGIFYPTEVTQTIGDAANGRVDTYTFEHVALNPDLPAAKLIDIPIPPGTLLIARKEKQPVARAKTDAHWNLKSAAAFLLDPTTTTQPAK